MTARYLVLLAAALLIGWGCGKLFENLPFRALGAAFADRWLKHLALGLAVGGATLGVAILAAVIFGRLRFEMNSSATTSALLYSLAVSFVVFAVAAAFEEALFRGYLLQTFTRSGLAWLAILLTSLFFGAAHAGNPGSGVISTANTVIAGIWFSAAYLKTRDLWFVWGIHLMWNFAQGAIFGIEVSGLTSFVQAPLFKEVDAGPGWLTGANYGIEGGVACTIALILSLTLIRYVPRFRANANLTADNTDNAD
jgi:hypothetical protein